MTCRIVVLLSGRGSNFRAIAEAGLPVEIAAVISNRPQAAGLDYARERGIPAVAFDHTEHADRAAFDALLAEEIERHRPDLVVLAGYMRILSPAFIARFERRLLNIHPSLLPSFPGLEVQKKAIEWGCKLAGCTVHFVTEGVDEGPIILQAAVPIFDQDTSDTLAARILEQEHKIYPRAVQLFAEGRLRVEGRRVLIEGGKPAGETVISPS